MCFFVGGSIGRSFEKVEGSIVFFGFFYEFGKWCFFLVLGDVGVSVFIV